MHDGKSGGMRKIRVGVIGLGVGERHVRAFQNHPQVEVVALCDKSEEKLAMAREKYGGVFVTREANKLLRNASVDAVSIASYDKDHSRQVVEGLKQGKHVFVEKPMCLSEEEARKIRQLLVKNPQLHLSSHFPLRRSPRFRELKKWLKAGSLGRLYYAEADYNFGRWEKIVSGWRGKGDNYSVVLGGGIHLVDLLLWLTEDKVEKVSAVGNNLASQEAGLTFNDLVVSNLKFSGGMLAKVTCNFACVHPHYHAVSVYGTKATFINGRKKAELFTGREEEPRQISTSYRQERQKESAPLLFSFIESILGRGEPEVTSGEVFNALSVCFAVERAVVSGRLEKVKYI